MPTNRLHIESKWRKRHFCCLPPSRYSERFASRRSVSYVFLDWSWFAVPFKTDIWHHPNSYWLCLQFEILLLFHANVAIFSEITSYNSLKNAIRTCRMKNKVETTTYKSYPNILKRFIAYFKSRTICKIGTIWEYTPLILLYCKDPFPSLFSLPFPSSFFVNLYSYNLAAW